MRSGELFAGVGGLGMAVDEVFGSTPAWFAELDAAPSKVLTHHFPDVPNYGDVTKLTNPERVQILAGGFPCQDVSLAGRRRGMKNGTRSGLWSEYARIIDEVRPDWVVIENVKGLLSADASVDMEPCPLCVGDDPRHVLRALGAVLGDLAELGFDAEWVGLRASDVGAPHGRFRVFILAWPRDRVSSNPSSFGWREGWAESARLFGRPDDVISGPSADLRLLPTPIVSDGTGGSKNLAKSDFAPQMRDISRLLPTPTVGNATGGNAQRGGVRASEKLLPGLAVEAAGGRLMPTPRATRGGSATEMSYAMGGSRSDGERPQGVVVPGTDWGPYAEAVERWGRAMGRGAPAPVRMDGRAGNARLNPELTEWMMGWPAGWVTDPAIGLSRAEQLKACGNGVVPQQAAAALRELLSRPGVPEVTP